mmetsp:Transcript_4295/g.11650  ORF Transcript_4295/g.11650 Transcript_4295/m.11650 type:complete len:302 (-) Transcript_4295:34-939(-)
MKPIWAFSRSRGALAHARQVGARRLSLLGLHLRLHIRVHVAHELRRRGGRSGDRLLGLLRRLAPGLLGLLGQLGHLLLGRRERLGEAAQLAGLAAAAPLPELEDEERAEHHEGEGAAGQEHVLHVAHGTIDGHDRRGHRHLGDGHLRGLRPGAEEHHAHHRRLRRLLQRRRLPVPILREALEHLLEAHADATLVRRDVREHLAEAPRGDHGHVALAVAVAAPGLGGPLDVRAAGAVVRLLPHLVRLLVHLAVGAGKPGLAALEAGHVAAHHGEAAAEERLACRMRGGGQEERQDELRRHRL